MRFRGRRRRGRPPHPDVLTPAEWRVLDEIREGRRNRDIAERLRLSIHTVKSHVASMLAKLDLTSRRQLAEWPGAPAQRDAHEADDRARTLRFAPVFGRTPPRAPW